MNTGLFILLLLWALSRATDVFSCTVMALRLKNSRGHKLISPAYKMFTAIAFDSFIASLMIVSIGPYLVLGWNPPPVWTLPALGFAAVSSTSFKTYTKFKVAIALLSNKAVI